MKKMKSLKEFKSQSRLPNSELEFIQGGANWPGTEYFEGECTNGGSDCDNIGYNDDGTRNSYVHHFNYPC